jgi:two-component system NtrC family sensor kinase
VACRWRIRHKLVLGLGLVVAILGLLLGGTLKGLASYRATMTTLGCKFKEVKKAQGIRDAAKLLPKFTSPQAEAVDLKGHIAATRRALDEYKEELDTSRLGLGDDPDYASHEQTVALGLNKYLDDVDEAMRAAMKNAVSNPDPQTPLLLKDPGVDAAVNKVIRTADELIDGIYTGLGDLRNGVRKETDTILIAVCAIFVVGVLLLAVLLRSYYGWVFYPIRALQEGAGRVAQGDFEQNIEVHSGDEIEDLAHAFNDMTGRLRDMYRDLARQVNERSRQLVRSERLASVGFLAAGVAHEINNPLHIIALHSEAIEGRLGDLLRQPRERQAQDLDTVIKYLKKIQDEAFRCKGITQQLLEFSRQGEPRREPTDLVELVQTVVDMMQHMPNCKGKELRFEPDGQYVAWVNGLEIRSVILNLVVNALDSMGPGGTLAVGLRQVPGPTGSLHDPRIEIEFADTGCGMTPEVLENIFEPFFTTKEPGKGTGLGLSISHRIVNQHGGEIEAASAGPGQGSVFTVRLLVQPPEAAREAA